MIGTSERKKNPLSIKSSSNTFQRKKAASAANIRPVLPAAVMRSAPFVVVLDDEVGFKLPELSVAVLSVCAAVTTAGVLCRLGKLIGARDKKK
jgi:hypothetical protein